MDSEWDDWTWLHRWSLILSRLRDGAGYRGDNWHSTRKDDGSGLDALSNGSGARDGSAGLGDSGREGSDLGNGYLNCGYPTADSHFVGRR